MRVGAQDLPVVTCYADTASGVVAALVNSDGLIEVFVVANLGGSWRDAISFAGLFLFLVLRPRGLLGAAVTREA